MSQRSLALGVAAAISAEGDAKKKCLWDKEKKGLGLKYDSKGVCELSFIRQTFWPPWSWVALLVAVVLAVGWLGVDASMLILSGVLLATLVMATKWLRSTKVLFGFVAECLFRTRFFVGTVGLVLLATNFSSSTGNTNNQLSVALPQLISSDTATISTTSTEHQPVVSLPFNRFEATLVEIRTNLEALGVTVALSPLLDRNALSSLSSADIEHALATITTAIIDGKAEWIASLTLLVVSVWLAIIIGPGMVAASKGWAVTGSLVPATVSAGALLSTEKCQSERFGRFGKGLALVGAEA